jgi:hypothetical protein
MFSQILALEKDLFEGFVLKINIYPKTKKQIRFVYECLQILLNI